MTEERMSIPVDATLFPDDALTKLLNDIDTDFKEAAEDSDEFRNLRDAGRVLATIAFDRGLIGEWLWQIEKNKEATR